MRAYSNELTSPSLVEAFERRSRWQIIIGLSFIFLGVGCSAAELLFHYEIGADGFDWIAWSFMIVSGFYCLGARQYQRIKRHGVIKAAKAMEAAFLIEDASDGNVTLFYVHTMTKRFAEAGWMDWRAETDLFFQPYATSKFRNFSGSESYGTIWFDPRSAKPIAVEIENMIVFLENAVPTAFDK